MSDRKALRVSIGPVQGFIASGRRTRDFWAGSFLLSWLSGVAMEAVIKGDGGITIPVVGKTGDYTEPTLEAIMKDAGANVPPGPLVGTLVNHFRAEVPGGFDISLINTAVRTKFAALADQVFEVFIEPSLTEGNSAGVKERWQAQTNGSFFEILAVMGDAPGWQEEAVWLERRKMLRTHAPILAEAGVDRCPVHGDLAELGGFSRQYRQKDQDAFWQNLREAVSSRMYGKGGGDAGAWSATGRKFHDTLEIRDSERLSGMALVKRLFPLLEPKRIAGVIGWMPDHYYNVRTQPQKKWNAAEAQYALRNWPSTAFIAALPWIVEVAGADAKAASSYAEAQYKTLGASPMLMAEQPQHHRVRGIDEVVKAKTNAWKFCVLDGALHFERGLEKHRFDDDQNTKKDDDQNTKKDDGQNTKEIASALQAEFKRLVEGLCEPKDDPKVKDGPASTHYAMLDMDGDSMGVAFSHSKPRAERASKALLTFSQEVPKIIREHDGVLIYAGADDVNAMLPIETAISCAQAINRLWGETFRSIFVCDKDPCDTPTLSGSIVFADYQNALDDVRRLTHGQLERVAKDGMGRNALALTVMKPGGVVSEWASCWQDQDARDTAQSLFDYAKAAAADKTIASRLPYLIRERYGEVLAGRSKTGGDLFDDDRLVDFLKTEVSGPVLSEIGVDEREKARRVVEILRPCYRDREKGDLQKAPRHVGGLLIARFLAQNCMWSFFEAWQERSGGAS